MFPTELYHYIVSKMDGFERENMRLVCKMFNEFEFVISSKNPARDREVLLIDCNRRFYELFEYGHIDIIRVCYKTYGDYSKTFYEACKYGFADFAKYLYNNYICLDRTMVNMDNVLLSAALGGNIDIIKMTIDHGATEFIMALKILCEMNHVGSFEYLLSISDIEPQMDDFICDACSSGNMDMVKRVMEFPTENPDYWQWTLFSACKGGNMDIINLCIEKGANDWDSGFKGACSGGHLEIAEMMIRKGAIDVYNIEDACYNGHIDIVRKQIELGCEDLGPGLCAAVSNGKKDIVELLIGQLSIDCCLIFIAANTSREIVEILIEHGARVDSMALCCALTIQDLDIVKLILKHGVKVNDWIIRWAENSGDKRILKYLKSLI